MSVPIRVELQTEPWEKKLRFLRGRFGNLRPVMEGPIRQLVRRAIDQQRKTQGAYGGKTWPPLSDYTIKRKEREGKAVPNPLVFDGTLYESLLKVGSNSWREEITSQGYTLRSMAAVDRGDDWDGYPYGLTHQLGLANVPMRQIIPNPMPGSFIRDLRRHLRGYLVGVEFGVPTV